MGFHHVAVATRDSKATHEFYTDSMGFELAKVVTGPTPDGGWAKHFFYETGQGDGLIAFWELHDDTIPADFSPAIATGLGLPVWTNHIAFLASDVDDLAERRKRLQSKGHDVLEVDHHFCRSIYVNDPNGIMVEFCCDTAGITDQDRASAQQLLHDPKPPQETPAWTKVHRANEA